MPDGGLEAGLLFIAYINGILFMAVVAMILCVYGCYFVVI